MTQKTRRKNGGAPNPSSEAGAPLDPFSMCFVDAPPPERPRRATWRPHLHPPVRRVVQQRPKRVCGYIASWKTGERIPWESTLERDFAVLLDTDPSVAEFFAQPVQVRYRLSGAKEQRYTPDFMVIPMIGRRYFVEVKPKKPRPNEPGYKNLAALFKSYGENLIVVREPQIRANPQHKNAWLCHRYARYPISEQFVVRVRSYLAPLSKVTCDTLLSSCAFPDKDGWPQLLSMICRGQLHFDKATLLTRQSLISLSPSSFER